MPALSLVVCLHNEREELQRLLQQSSGCYDDLVVIHDGPDTTGARAVVEGAGGRFFERPREYQEEPHWPFAWGQAAHDWILRLDADEFPSGEMKAWLARFRAWPEPGPEISGYNCIWPFWNGRRAVSKRWPSGRFFLFHRRRVRFFGLTHQEPIADGKREPLEVVLHHQPKRKSYGFGNILFRKQGRLWNEYIARSLQGKPTDLCCWRWDSGAWPGFWEQIRQRPFRTALARFGMQPLRTMRDQWQRERRILPVAAINGSLQQAMICLAFWRLRRQCRRRAQAERRPAND